MEASALQCVTLGPFLLTSTPLDGPLGIRLAVGLPVSLCICQLNQRPDALGGFVTLPGGCWALKRMNGFGQHINKAFSSVTDMPYCAELFSEKLAEVSEGVCVGAWESSLRR